MAPSSAGRPRSRWLLGALAALVLALGILLVYWRLLLTNRVLVTGDAFTYFTPYRDYANAALRSGHLPLWNPYLFLGVPFLANPQTAVLYPLHWPFIELPAAKSLIASVALHLWLAGLGATLYARRVARLSWLPALATGLLFSLSGFLGAHVAQVNQVSAAAWLPWLLWLLEEAWHGDGRPAASWQRRIRWTALAALSLAIGLQFLAGHTQSSYINLVGLGVAAIWPGVAALVDWTWQRARRRPASLDGAGLTEAGKRLALAALAVLLGAGLAAVQLLPTAELAGQSVRSGGLPYREAVSFSLRPRNLLLSLLPSYGENLADRFGTPAFAEFVAYVGVGGLVLAFLGLAAARRRQKPGGRSPVSSPAGLATGLVLVGFGLALGAYNPLTYLLYKLVPGFDLFRAPARWMLLYAFGISVLAGFGFEAVRAGLPAFSLSRRPRRRTLPVIAILGLVLLAFLAWQQWPKLPTVALWLAIGAAVLALARWGRARWARVALVGLVLVELAAASLVLDHTRPTAPEAVSSLRTAPAHLLAAAQQAEAQGEIPGRFLSMSGITYDPGDLAEMQQILAGQLPEQAIYHFVVASKEQEIVAPNLPLLWRLPAVDGYDGGVLPLRRYVDLQTLFVPAEDLAPDGRLREQLRTVPASRLLRLLGVSHVITDKEFDVWWDDVYYDLELSSELAPGQAVIVDAADRLESTRFGLFSHLAGGAAVAQGTPVAEVVVEDEDGGWQRFELRAGQETAEGQWAASDAHRQPDDRQPRPRDQAGWDYLARFDLAGPATPDRITVRNLLPAGTFVLRGISLMDGRTGTHVALTVPADGRFQRVHSGDVKVYRNLASLPRAYLVGQARVVADDDATLAAVAEPSFDPAGQVLLLETQLADEGLLERVEALHSGGAAGGVRVESYEPERIVLHEETPEPTLLVLADSWYNGWQATIDGEPAPILRADLMFRAVLLPPGAHQVVFQFTPDSLRVGALVSGAALLAILGLLVLAVALNRRSR